MLHTCCGRWLTKPVARPVTPLPQTCSDCTEFILDTALRCGTFFNSASSIAKPSIFCSYFSGFFCCLPQPHPPLHQQQPEVCPSEVLCAVLTAVSAQNFMLYFGGEEIPLIQACEVFFFSLSEVSVPDLPIA